MNRYLTEIYCHLLCKNLRELMPQKKCRGGFEYETEIVAAEKRSDMHSVMEISGTGPRDLSFRMADIVKYRRSKIWLTPAFIFPKAGEGIYLKDTIFIHDGVDIGELARATAEGLSIFVEKYLSGS